MHPRTPLPIFNMQPLFVVYPFPMASSKPHFLFYPVDPAVDRNIKVWISEITDKHRACKIHSCVSESCIPVCNFVSYIYKAYCVNSSFGSSSFICVVALILVDFFPYKD